jgi:hypothetical protein
MLSSSHVLLQAWEFLLLLFSAIIPPAGSFNYKWTVLEFGLTAVKPFQMA